LYFLCSVDRSSRYNRVKNNQLDAQHILSICRKPVHVSDVSVPIIRRYNHMYTTIGIYYSFWKTVCCRGWIQPGQQSYSCTDRHTVYLLMMGLDTPETCRG